MPTEQTQKGKKQIECPWHEYRFHNWRNHIKERKDKHMTYIQNWTLTR